MESGSCRRLMSRVGILHTHDDDDLSICVWYALNFTPLISQKGEKNIYYKGCLQNSFARQLPSSSVGNFLLFFFFSEKGVTSGVFHRIKSFHANLFDVKSRLEYFPNNGNTHATSLFMHSARIVVKHRCAARFVDCRCIVLSFAKVFSFQKI